MAKNHIMPVGEVLDLLRRELDISSDEMVNTEMLESIITHLEKFSSVLERDLIHDSLEK